MKITDPSAGEQDKADNYTHSLINQWADISTTIGDDTAAATDAVNATSGAAK